jgi:hypothetical protein
VNASDLATEQFVRLRLGSTLGGQFQRTTALPDGDVRCKSVHVPTTVGEDLGEWLGLMAADGTVYARGLRLVKRHQDVVRRFAGLCKILFGLEIPVTAHKTSPAWCAEISSTRLSAWCAALGGLSAKQKSVPDCVMRSPVCVQRRFLRGLFEDGSVSPRDGSVELTTHSLPVAEKTQLLLLRCGIASVLKSYPSQPATHRRLHVQGGDVQTFRDTIRFISAFKNAVLDAIDIPKWRGRHIPIDTSQLGKTLCIDVEARKHGYISRNSAERYGQKEALLFHHDTITSITECEGPSMCVTVPEGGRFLQNGFDGFNSQGSQWDNVLLLDESGAFGDDASKHLYTGITRAAKKVTIRL